MTTYKEKVLAVLEAATSAVKSIEETGQLGQEFVLAVTLCELILADPGSSAQSKDAAKKTLAKFEASLKKAAKAQTSNDAEKVAI
jgi:hypothetical protein